MTPEQIIELAKEIAWPLVWILSLIVLIIYRIPLGELIPKIKKGQISKEGLNISVGDEPNEIDAVVLPDEILSHNHDPIEIVDELSDTVSKQVKDKEGLKDRSNNWGYVGYVEKDYKKARKILLSNLLEETSDNPSETKAYAAYFLSRDYFQKGNEEFLELRKQYPEEGIVYSLHASTFTKQGLFRDAISILDKAPKTVSKINMLLLDKARILNDLNEIEVAKETIDSILENATISKNASNKTSAYIELGRIHENDNDIDKAKDAYLKAYKTSPDENFTIVQIAEFFRRISDPKNELFFRMRSSELNSDYVAVWVTLGNVYLELSLNDLAMEAYDNAKSIAREDESWIFANIGNLLNNVGLYSRAIPYLEKSLELDSLSQYNNNRLANILDNKKKENDKANIIINEIRATL